MLLCVQGCKKHYLVEKWKDFRQYFNIKVGVFGQVAGRVWAGNQDVKTLGFVQVKQAVEAVNVIVVAI